MSARLLCITRFFCRGCAGRSLSRTELRECKYADIRSQADQALTTGSLFRSTHLSAICARVLVARCTHSYKIFWSIWTVCIQMMCVPITWDQRARTSSLMIAYAHPTFTSSSCTFVQPSFRFLRNSHIGLLNSFIIYTSYCRPQ